MNRLYGIVVEIPKNFTEDVLLLYKDEESATKDIQRYQVEYGINSSINAVIVPSKKNNEYHYFIHGPFHLDIPKAITCNMMKIKAAAGSMLINTETNEKVSVMVDPRYLSPLGSPEWYEGNLIDKLMEEGK